MKDLPLKIVKGVRYRKINNSEYIREDESRGGNNLSLQKGAVTNFMGTTYNPDLRAIYKLYTTMGKEPDTTIEYMKCVGMRELPQYPFRNNN